MSTNEELNKQFPNYKCEYCGCGYPKTILNIEGCIHHGSILRCIDQKSCRRRRRKKKKC